MQTYNIHEAAEVLKCHHHTVCHMCRTGEIEAFSGQGMGNHRNRT